MTSIEWLEHYAITKSKLLFIETFNLKPYKDGNQWCILLGQDIQEGIAGFGDSPIQAIEDFNNQMYQSLKQPKQ